MAAIWIVATGEDVGSSQVGLSDNLGDVGGRRFHVRGHEKVPTGGQVVVSVGGQLEVPTVRVVS